MSQSPRYGTIYRYAGLHGCQSWCEVRVWNRPDRRLVVMLTELPDNPGTSVTNYFENLASELLLRVVSFSTAEFVEPKEIIWIQHYPRARSSRLAETWDAVALEWDGRKYSHPQWKHLSEAKVDSLIEGK